MVTKEELYYDSRDHISKIHAVRFIPDGKPKAILQIVHGMAEHIGRYEEFATWMAEQGFLVIANDHLGHGKSVSDNGTYGYFCKNDPTTVLVRDVHRLKKLTQETYPGIPCFILGHSMGSFLVRNYICKYGTGIQGAIVMATGMPPKSSLTFGKAFARMQNSFCGSTHVSNMLHQLIFGKCNDKIENAKTEWDWLCRDEATVERYMADKRCGFKFTANGFQTFFEMILRLYKHENLAGMPADLPVMLMAGSEDPVGRYFEDIKMLADSYEKIGMQDVTVKKYDGARHELLHEPEKKTVFEDISNWLLQKMTTKTG